MTVLTVAFIVYSLAYSLGSNVNGLEEPSLAKRLRGTPERIELENYRLSLQREEELEEVPEETLAEHNLSSVLDKGAEEDVPSRLAHFVSKLFCTHPNRLWPAFPSAFSNVLFARMPFLKLFKMFCMCTQLFYLVVSILTTLPCYL